MFVTGTIAADLHLEVARRRLAALLDTAAHRRIAAAALRSGGAGVPEGQDLAVGGLTVTGISPYDRHGTVVLPLRWTCPARAGVLSVLDGNLEMQAAGGRTLLRLVGTYRLPLGTDGGEHLLHEVGHATTRAFLTGVAELLTGGAILRVGTQPAGHPAGPDPPQTGENGRG